MKGTVAKKYARALFEAAREEGKEEEIYKEIERVEKFLSQETIEFLSLPSVAFEKKMEVLDTLRGLELHPFLLNTLLLLTEKGRARIIPDVLSFYRKFYMEEKGYIVVEIRAAREMKESRIQFLKEQLERFTGGKVYLHMEVEPELIGGMVIKIGDMLIDNSVRTKIEKLAEALKGVRP